MKIDSHFLISIAAGFGAALIGFGSAGVNTVNPLQFLILAPIMSVTLAFGRQVGLFAVAAALAGSIILAEFAIGLVLHRFGISYVAAFIVAMLWRNEPLELLSIGSTKFQLNNNGAYVSIMVTILLGSILQVLLAGWLHQNVWDTWLEIAEWLVKNAQIESPVVQLGVTQLARLIAGSFGAVEVLVWVANLWLATQLARRLNRNARPARRLPAIEGHPVLVAIGAAFVLLSVLLSGAEAHALRAMLLMLAGATISAILIVGYCGIHRQFANHLHKSTILFAVYLMSVVIGFAVFIIFCIGLYYSVRAPREIYHHIDHGEE